MKGLSGKTAIVTGGSRGIGLAVVERLLQEGTRVVFTGRNSKVGEEAEKTLKKSGDALFLAGDMGEEDFCRTVTEQALARFGRIDFLVNNAFPFTAKGLDATRQDWLHVWEAGPVAYATMIQYFVKLRGKETPGSIVNLSSIAGHMPDKGRWTYCAAKGAVNMISKCAAIDLAPHIRVNTISAGCVWTDEVSKSIGNAPPRPMDSPVFRNQQLIDRVIRPEEMASSVVYLLSDESSGMTGADMAVDGGYLVIGPNGWKYEADWTGSSN